METVGLGVMTPKIAVITPTIPPRKKLLRRAVMSVSDQTLTPAYHCIAIDHLKEGAPVTRQNALDMVPTKANWIAPLDDDDEFKDIHLEHLWKHAMDTGADYVYSWFEVIGIAGRKWGNFDPVFPPGHFSNEFDPENPVETTITVLVRAELAREVGYQAMHRGERNTGEDYNFLLNCLKAGAKVSHLVERTWYWHHDSNNTSGLPTRW